jgi:putative transcriptional regulator
VFFGGPVQFDHGFVLHRPVGAWKSTLPVGEIGLTTSRDILEAMSAGQGPHQQLVALGYAGWAPGQLEDEIRRNGWLTVEADVDVIFDVPPEARYAAAMHALGVNAANLSEEAGHA